MLGPGISLAAGSRHSDFRGATDQTMPPVPVASADDTARKPPGMPPGAAVLNDAAVPGPDSAMGVVVSAVPL
jgi:hypothetical protein